MIDIQRREKALQLLAHTDIKPDIYAPPLWQCFWESGWDVPPPHFAGYWVNTVLTGAIFSAGFECMFLLLMWIKNIHIDLPIFTLVCAIGGVIFGLFIATYYFFTGRQQQLPSWKSLGTPPQPTLVPVPVAELSLPVLLGSNVRQGEALIVHVDNAGKPPEHPY